MTQLLQGRKRPIRNSPRALSRSQLLILRGISTFKAGDSVLVGEGDALQGVYAIDDFRKHSLCLCLDGLVRGLHLFVLLVPFFVPELRGQQEFHCLRERFVSCR